MTCKIRKWTPPLAAAGLLLTLAAGSVQAQGPSGLTGDLSYTRGNGSGGYGSHSLEANVEPAALPLSLGFNATQSLVDGAEVSTQVGASVGWRASPVWSFAANLSTANDDLLNVSSQGLSVAWNLHKLWQGRRTTRLEVGRNVSDYSLQKGTQALVGRIPQQRRTRLDVRQGLSDAVDVYLGLETYDYSQDPVDLARALLNRKVRRVAAANMLSDLTDRSQTVGLGWSLADAWNLDVSTTRSSTVVGQNQWQKAVALSFIFHPKASVTLVYSDSSSDALTHNGLTLSPAQADSTLELGIKRIF